MAENKNSLNKEEFLKKYRIENCFKQSDLSWDNLSEIYADYLNDFENIQNCCRSFESFCRNALASTVSVHSIRCRPKDPEHLIEKIIRKRGREQAAKYKSIDAENYKETVRDLIGLRILVIKKEDWEAVFDELVRIFPSDPSCTAFMAEPPIAYTRYGDRDIYKDKIKKEYSNKGYRSQHYIIKYEGIYCEIQARTLAEEVYGEFDHLVKYPYREDNNFLLRYTNTLSQLTNSIDEMISTCFQLKEDGWAECEKWFEKDSYINWSKTSQNLQDKSILRDSALLNEDNIKAADGNLPIDMQKFANNILLRKGN